jgi:hypothetical protein
MATREEILVVKFLAPACRQYLRRREVEVSAGGRWGDHGPTRVRKAVWVSWVFAVWGTLRPMSRNAMTMEV